MPARESRRSPRAKHDSVLEIYDTDGNLIIGIGRLVNFSNTGVCFSSTKALKQGQKLHARLRLLKEGILETSARIVWTQKLPNRVLYGLQFDDIQQIRPTVF